MQKVKLGDVIDVKRGMTLSGEFYSTEGNFIRLTLGNFNYPACGWKNNTSKDNLYFTGEIRKEFILNKGDIITPLTEQVRGLLGNTATIPESNLYIQSGDIGLIIPDESKIDKRFSYYLVSSDVVKKQLDVSSQQTKIRHTSPDAIMSCVAFIPDLPEQRKIAKLLDGINNKIEINNKINDNLQNQMQTLYDYWFVQFDFPNKDGKPYKSSGGKMVWNESLRQNIPEAWTTRKLSSIINISNERILPSEIKDRVYVPIEVIPRKRISFYETSDTSKATTGLCPFQTKAILLSNRRVYFHKVCISPFDGVTRDTVIIITPNEERNLGFIYETVFSEHFISYATKNSYGSEQPVLSPTTVMDYVIAYPNDSLDHSYSNIVCEMIDQVLMNERENKQLLELRNLLLPLLMTGQAAIE